MNSRDALTKQIADRYISRDGSPVGTHSKKRDITRAAVLAAQQKLAELHGGKSPIPSRSMHAALVAALKASPELGSSD